MTSPSPQNPSPQNPSPHEQSSPEQSSRLRGVGRRAVLAGIGAAPALAVGAAHADPSSGRSTAHSRIEVDVTATRQALRGIGGITYAQWIGDLTAAQRETAFGTGEDQLGMSVLRVPVPPDRADWDADLATARRARELGAIVFASPWYPPEEMRETFRREEPVGSGTPHPAETGTVLTAAHVEQRDGQDAAVLEGAGSSVRWDVLGMGTTGAKRLTIRVLAAQSGAALRILANDAEAVAELVLPEGTSWAEVEADVPFEAGDNSLELIALGDGEIAVDEIRIRGIQIQEDASRLARSSYADYARHLADFVAHMEAGGAPLEAISIQNEPDYAEDWTWWTPAEMIDFLRDHAASIPCRIIAPESFQYVKSTSDPIIEDPEAWAQVDVLGAHLYGTPAEELPYPLFEQHRGDRELWMTEVYTPNSEPDSNERWPEALQVGESIHDALVIGGFQAYVWWYIRRNYGPISEDGTISRRGHVMGHYSRVLRAGSQRLALESEAPEGVRESAYLAADGAVVIVAINASDAEVARPYRVRGTKVRGAESWRTSADERSVRLPDATVRGGKLEVTLPAQSITTYVVR
ncbi:glycoside hydrolase family 30 beta sandwich domain-containing protein [Brachybacterium sp. DNPG3]